MLRCPGSLKLPKFMFICLEHTKRCIGKRCREPSHALALQSAMGLRGLADVASIHDTCVHHQTKDQRRHMQHSRTCEYTRR